MSADEGSIHWETLVTIMGKYIIIEYRHETEQNQGHVNLAGFPNAALWQRDMQVELRHKPGETSLTPSRKKEHKSPINGNEKIQKRFLRLP